MKNEQCAILVFKADNTISDFPKLHFSTDSLSLLWTVKREKT